MIITHYITAFKRHFGHHNYAVKLANCQFGNWRKMFHLFGVQWLVVACDMSWHMMVGRMFWGELECCLAGRRLYWHVLQWEDKVWYFIYRLWLWSKLVPENSVPECCKNTGQAAKVMQWLSTTFSYQIISCGQLLLNTTHPGLKLLLGSRYHVGCSDRHADWQTAGREWKTCTGNSPVPNLSAQTWFWWVHVVWISWGDNTLEGALAKT